MDILSNLRRSHLKPDWEYRTTGTVWRLLPAAYGMLIGEDRNSISTTTSFFCLDESTGRPRWEKIQFSENWWIGIETVHRGVLFLHEYTRPDMPAEGKIIAVELSTGRLLWSNVELRFQFAYENSVYASKDNFESKRFLQLDLFTGSVENDIGDGADFVNTIRAKAAAIENDAAKHPQPVDTSTPGKHSLPSAVTSVLPLERIAAVELLDEPPYLIVGYYTGGERSETSTELDQHLKIFDSVRGKVVYEDVMARRVKSSAPDLFFSRHGYLFYVKHNNTLVGVRLDR